MNKTPLKERRTRYADKHPRPWVNNNRGRNSLSIIQDAILFLAVVSVLFGATALDQNVNAGSDSIDGLRLSLLTQEGNSVKEPQFRVEFFNTGENDLVLDLGLMLAGKQYSDAFKLTLTDAKGKSWELIFNGPGAIAGRADPMIVFERRFLKYENVRLFMNLLPGTRADREPPVRAAQCGHEAAKATLPPGERPSICLTRTNRNVYRAIILVG